MNLQKIRNLSDSPYELHYIEDFAMNMATSLIFMNENINDLY